MALLEITDVSKVYGGQTVLEPVSLAIDAGQSLALIGPTGSGKTTLLRLMNLLEPPSSGNICLDGEEITSSSQRLAIRRRMAFVQQKPAVFTMSVRDNVACGLKWRSRKQNLQQQVGSALEMVGLEGYENRQAKTLSGGETQRLAIARALVVEPEILFLDEPTANLDPVSTANIEEILAGIVGKREITVVMATHDMTQGQRLGQRIAVLLAGQLVQVGTPSDIFSSPWSRELAEFVGIENIIPGALVEREENLLTVEVGEHRIQAVAQGHIPATVYLLVRPEDVTFAPAPARSSARNSFSARVTRITPAGPLTRVEVDCGFPLFGVLTRSSAEELDLGVGKEVFASFKATAAHVIPRHSQISPD